MKPDKEMNEEKPNVLGILIVLGAVGTLLYYSIKLLFV